MNVSDYLSQLQVLTKQNLEILQALNDSFFTKDSHITVSVANTSYVIPSFLSLENKIDSLTADFENLVNVPKTGEAYFNFDGNSQSIEMRGFNCAPNKISLSAPDKFGVSNNDIFKDFLTPMPYIHFDASSIQDDVNNVLVRKVIPRSSELKNIFKGWLADSTSIQKSWADLYKVLSIYKEDEDFIMYDTRKSLPLRQTVGSATYVISKIEKDEIDDNLEEYITIKFRSDFSGVPDASLYTPNLTYKLFDETIEKDLVVGDCLTTFNNGTKLEIVSIKPALNTVVVKVLNGEYLNLVESTGSNISDLSKLKFYSTADLTEGKYIDVPLEEDQYIFIAVSPLNDRLRIQSSWGEGVVVNTYKLTKDNETFESYYKENVRNIGDILFEITSMLDNTLTKYSADEFNKFTGVVPVVNPKNIDVYQINSHLDDSMAIKNIRSLYSQKKQYESDLNSINNEINSINEELSSISFDDTTGKRSALTANLTAKTTQKNELVTSIRKIIDEIAQNANNSDVPIENAKYRIRGFYDYASLYKDDSELESLIKEHMIGIEVWYRYKNYNATQGTARSINDSFIFSDWNRMSGFNISKIPSINSSGHYVFKNEADNSKKNEPSSNQIDIPISQGEAVDIILKVVYDFGSPFCTTTTQWSEIYTVDFPEEFTKNVQILDIISENNSDIETNRFNNILEDTGTTSHVGDKIQDQDITYFHKPENIASGFYTSERRIIPLKDKLTEMNNLITELQDAIEGASTNNMEVSISIGDTKNVLAQNSTTNISVVSVDELTDNSSYLTEGAYTKNENGVISTILNLSLTNKSSHSIRLYSVFPGSRGSIINGYKFKDNWKDYAHNDPTSTTSPGQPGGVWSLTYSHDGVEHDGNSLQTCNQFIYFRLNNLWNNDIYYESGSVYGINNKLSYESSYYRLPSDGSKVGAAMYTTKNNEYSMCLQSDSTNESLTLNSGESIIVPIIFEYKLDGTLPSITKTMTFDIRTSLYSDPVNYAFNVSAKSTSTNQDKLIRASKKENQLVKYNSTVKA